MILFLHHLGKSISGSLEFKNYFGPSYSGLLVFGGKNVIVQPGYVIFYGQVVKSGFLYWV